MPQKRLPVLHDLISSIGQAKPQGIPKESLALGIVFKSIFGYTAGIRAVDSVSRTDFGLLAGLPFLSSPSTQYRYLQSVSVKDALYFKSSVTPEMIHREFIDGVQGRVQLSGNVITVNVYGFEHQAAAASILTNLDSKLSKAKIDSRIPWLGNRRLHFLFY